MALGWCGSNSSLYTVKNYEFSDSSLKLLKRIESDGFSLGCRDYYSKKILSENGFRNSIMTGCAAWYDLTKVESTALTNCSEIRKICVSDPAQRVNFDQYTRLLKFIKDRFPGSSITAVFHRGVSEQKRMDIDKLGIDVIDISNGAEGFSFYDDCDIHIGYRVHAHIYNLSGRRRSILIEEDGRGAGINTVLGLDRITAYDSDKVTTNRYHAKLNNLLRIKGRRSQFVLEQIADCLERYEENNYIEMEWAFERMKHYYKNMRSHLGQLKKLEE